MYSANVVGTNFDKANRKKKSQTPRTTPVSSEATTPAVATSSSVNEVEFGSTSAKEAEQPTTPTGDTRSQTSSSESRKSRRRSEQRSLLQRFLFLIKRLYGSQDEGGLTL